LGVQAIYVTRLPPLSQSSARDALSSAPLAPSLVFILLKPEGLFVY
jgi:hypothetical protein